jgi:hypothetical protein
MPPFNYGCCGRQFSSPIMAIRDGAFTISKNIFLVDSKALSRCFLARRQFQQIPSTWVANDPSYGEIKRITNRRFTLLALLAIATSKAGADTQKGPFCWAGKDADGHDKFISCHPDKKRKLSSVEIDTDAFGGLVVRTEQETVTVSREQFLAALDGWRTENRAKT